MKSYHFAGLTEIRGIAAFFVLVSHIDQFHYIYNTQIIGLYQTGMAGHAVTMFFVLSGFLITFLLLEEKRHFKKIQIKKFYMRRILRIWPVYYLSLAIAVFLILTNLSTSPNNFLLSTFLYLVMAPNLSYSLSMSIRCITPLWSIGVEEQFYILWPLIVSSSNKLFNLLILIIALYCIFKVTVFYYKPDGGLYALTKATRIDCMAIGGVFSYLLFINKEACKRILFSPILLIFSVFVLIVPLLVSFKLPANFEIEIYAVSCGIFISNVALNKKSFIKLSSRVLFGLGKISYGMYVYHMFIILFIGPYLENLNIVLIYIIISALTIVISKISYRFFESRFLNLKGHYSILKSGF